MAIPTKFGLEFTDAELEQMRDAAQSITNIIRAKMEINLTNEERKTLSKVGDDRLPYVLKSISTYAEAYPQFTSLAYPAEDAEKDAETFGQLFQVSTLMDEANEAVTEMQMVAGHFAYRFMRDQFYNASRYLGDNVEGAQVVYDGLKDCFEVSDNQASDDPEADPESL